MAKAKGALIASQEALAQVGTPVPILVCVTIETTGTMLVGTDVEAAVAALELGEAGLASPCIDRMRTVSH